MTVLACIDGSRYAASVCDHAAWIATRLDTPVEVVHVLDRHLSVAQPAPDRSGQLGVGSRGALMAELAELDEQRNRLEHESGRKLLDAAAARIHGHGVETVYQRLAHGELADHIAHHEPAARVIVVGRRGTEEDQAPEHLGRNLERLVRASTRPVVIAAAEFRPVSRFLIAYDGGRSAERAVDALIRNPVLTSAEGHLVMVGKDTADERNRLATAASRLRDAGYSISESLMAGDPDRLIVQQVDKLAVELLVMGAYGHSRIRTRMIGSTTTSLLRAVTTSMLVMH